jgi:3-oxoacyl-[acyl-carrier-protein] synthase II
MVKEYGTKIAISADRFAISNIGRTWSECWNSLLAGTRLFSRGSDLMPNWPDVPPLSAIVDFGSQNKQPPFERRTYELTRLAGSTMKPAVDAMFASRPEVAMSLIVATSHGDPGPLSTIVDNDHRSGSNQSIPLSVWEGVLVDKLVQAATTGLQRDLSGITISAACASALVAMSYAADRINAGLADAVIVIAVDTLSRVASVGFTNIGAMSKTGCTPYDRNRDGTTVGEGAIAMILCRDGFLPIEKVAGYVAGSGVYCDAAHMVEPNPVGVARAVKDAIAQSRLDSTDIRAVFWHGTGTRQNDKTEAAVSQIVFGNMSPPCTSTKGSLGHTLGASGGFNVFAACEANTCGLVPHVAGLVDPEYPNLDLITKEPRKIFPGPILLTALGFGGINAALVVTPALETVL